MASSLELLHVSVGSIIRDVSLSVAPGEAVALIGRSGAGKTTILRLLNGLAVPTTGTVSIDSVPLGGEMPALRRRIGTILQTPALFPHRTVYDNIATVPRLLGWTEDRVNAAVRDFLAQLGMPFEDFAPRFPRSLSGGEQQRAGIARAMIAAPPLLLCDEPFSALDPLVRRELQDEFVALRGRGGVTMVFVTHDVGEALRVAERIILVERGAIVCDQPRAGFLSSDVPLVRRFIEAARLPATA